jgi:hypothetical protein
MAINEDQELQIFFNTQGSMREADSESNVAYLPLILEKIIPGLPLYAMNFFNITSRVSYLSRNL